MGNGITWSVNGTNITEEQVSDKDLTARIVTDVIPQNLIAGVAGSRGTIQLSLDYDGYFGYTAVLAINVGRANAGSYANLYYYNTSTGELELVCTDQIAEDGIAELSFAHASDYVIVIDDQARGGNSTGTSSANNSNTQNTQNTKVTSPPTGDHDLIVGGGLMEANAQNGKDGLDLTWLLLIGAAVIAMAGTTAYFIRKKVENED